MVVGVLPSELVVWRWLDLTFAVAVALLLLACVVVVVVDDVIACDNM